MGGMAFPDLCTFQWCGQALTPWEHFRYSVRIWEAGEAEPSGVPGPLNQGMQENPP